jgi:hypothetical protein
MPLGGLMPCTSASHNQFRRNLHTIKKVIKNKKNSKCIVIVGVNMRQQFMLGCILKNS